MTIQLESEERESLEAMCMSAVRLTCNNTSALHTRKQRLETTRVEESQSKDVHAHSYYQHSLSRCTVSFFERINSGRHCTALGNHELH